MQSGPSLHIRLCSAQAVFFFSQLSAPCYP